MGTSLIIHTKEVKEDEIVEIKVLEGSQGWKHNPRSKNILKMETGSSAMTMPQEKATTNI
jgi:hypothetical protein